MRKVFVITCIGVCVNLFSFLRANAQTCSSTLSNGQNLVINGDFSQGYTGWTHDAGYTQYTYCSSCYSSPGNIYVHDIQDDFNPGAFPNFPDHSPSSDGMMLMVDGVCTNGINLWSQSNIPIAPNTNYYFTVWIASLKGGAGVEPGKLNFNINGTDLATNIQAPVSWGTWIKFTAVWNSGLTPPATATISIQNTNTTGCNNGVDFIIDDISFSPGCDYGNGGPTPDLGPDFSICGKTLPFNINPNFNAATQAAPNVAYTWFKDNVQVASGFGSAFYNFSVNAPGTYAVCTDSAGSCKKTDIIVISNTYSIDLGPDQTLCNPIVASLDARYTGPGVTYQWSLGGTAISGATSQIYSANTPGTYSVLVHDPSCGDKSDAIVITTLAAVANNGTFCPTSGTGKASLSVTGPGKYKWWTTPNTSGTALATGPNYTTPVLAGPGPYTYYVQDTSTFHVTVGPPATGNGFTNVASISGGDNNSKLVFNALTDFRIDTITVLPYNYYCPGPPYTGGNPNTISFIIYDSSGAVVGTTPLTSFQCQGQGTPAPPLKVPVGINIPQGNGYQIRLNTGSTQFAIYLNTTNGGNIPSPELYHYPTTYSNAIQFVGNNTQTYTLYYSPDAFPGYFDWKITKGVNCQFVPVYATEVCPSCVSIVAPTSINSSVTSFCKGSVATIDITPVGGSGDSLILYTGSCGGTRVAANATGAAFTGIPAPTTTTTYFARWESAPNCKSACVSVTVTPVDPPSASNPGTNQNICNTASATLNATPPATGTGAWSVVSGTGTITNPADPLSGVTGIAAGNLVLAWTVSNSPCAATSSQVTIHESVAVTPSSFTASVPDNFCKATTVGTITLTISGGSGDQLMLYSGSCGGTKVDSNTTGNPFTVPVPSTATTYFARWESANNCNSSCLSKTLTPVNSPSSSIPGTDQNICNPAAILNATAPAVGTGAWSVVSGTGTVTDPTDPHSTVTGIGGGDLILAWTVSNSPCADSTNQITIHSTAPVTPASMGSDIAFCKGSLSTIIIPVSGGSGDQLMLYSGACGGTKVDSSTTAPINFTLPSPAAVTDYFVRWESAGNCNSSCLTIKVTPVDSSSVSNAGTAQNICNTDSTSLHAIRPANGTGTWSVVSGTGTITNPGDSLSVVTGIGAGDLILQWKVSNNPCPADSSTVTIHRTVSVAPDSLGRVTPFCKGASTINLTAFGGSGDSLMLYEGSCGGTRLGSNATGAAFVVAAPTTATAYFARWESANSCNSSCVSITVTPVDSSSASNPGTDQNICNTDSTILHAAKPIIGIGVWSVVSGTGTITNPSDSLSTVTGIGAGNLVLQWKVSSNPCPADSNQITIRRTGSVAPDSLGKVTPFCNNGTASTINIQVFGGSGDSLILYKGSCAGIRVDGNATGAAFVIPAPTVATTYFARWESANNCNSTCASVTVTPVDRPSNVSAGTNQNICGITGASLHAAMPVIGTGVWSVVSGTGTITTPTDSLSTVTGIGVGDLILAWTVSNSPCPDSIANVTIHRDTLTAPVIAGASFDTCALTTGAVYSTTVNQPSSSYTWTTTGAGTTLNITSQVNNTATVDIGSSGGILTVTETLGACSLSDSSTITIASNVIQPFISDSVQTSCIFTGTLSAMPVLVGNGHWTVTSGSAVFADPNDPHSAVSGLGTGTNILTWTVTGCGGPKSANVTFNVASSNIVLDATGPTDTACAGKLRDMSVSVTGGSGGFNYNWTSSNNSFTTMTKNTSVTVDPQAGLITYYVIATDTVNTGCFSNVDSVKIYTVADQILTSNNLITPNRDNMNERLIVTDLNTHQAILPGSSLEVFNRWGERVFKSENYDNNWDAAGLNDGVYYFQMKAGCGGGQFKGWIQVIDSLVK